MTKRTPTKLTVLAALASEMAGHSNATEALGLDGPDLMLALAVTSEAGLITRGLRPAITPAGWSWARRELTHLRDLFEGVNLAADMTANELEVAAHA